MKIDKTRVEHIDVALFHLPDPDPLTVPTRPSVVGAASRPKPCIPRTRTAPSFSGLL